jgi:hypothetical protein
VRFLHNFFKKLLVNVHGTVYAKKTSYIHMICSFYDLKQHQKFTISPGQPWPDHGVGLNPGTCHGVWHCG